MALLRLAVFSLLAERVVSQEKACYFRGGGPADGYVACPGPNGTRTAACCASRDGWPHIDPCLSNGFCFSSDVGAVYRGACTDSTWGTTECPQQCQNVNRANTAWLSVCADLSLCCSTLDDDNLNDCCQNGTASGRNDKFMWNDATFTGNMNASTLYSVYDSRQAINGTIQNESGNSTIPTPGNSDTDSVSQGAVIGVGVGLGIPLLVFIGTSIWLFLALKKERRNQRDFSNELNEPVMSGSASMMKNESTAPSQLSPYDSVPRHSSAQDGQPSSYAHADNFKPEHSTTLAIPTTHRPVELDADQGMVEAAEAKTPGPY